MAMENLDAFVAGTLETLREELAQAERAESEAEHPAEIHQPGVPYWVQQPSRRYAEERRRPEHTHERTTPIALLTEQVHVLEQIQTMLAEQRRESQQQFEDIVHTYEQSSRRSNWLSVMVGAICLIAGWLLSLVDSPAALLRLFGH